MPLGYIFEFASEISYQNDKLIQPRIIKNKNFIDTQVSSNGGICELCKDETIYTYDKLGRIKRKEHKIFDAFFDKYTGFTVDTIYKPNTLLKDEIEAKIVNPSSPDTLYSLSYAYDNRGNMVISTLTQNYDGSTTYLENSFYNYDKANRLLEVENNGALGNTVTKYTYNVDGSINTESVGSTTKKYCYKKGRLDYFYNESSPTNITYFKYDNLGNCTYYMREPRLSANMEWERGNLLKKYIGSSGTTSYFYNCQGIRFRKEVPDGKHTDSINYYYDGSKLLGEKHSDTSIRYMYDIDEIIGFMILNTYPYHFVKDAIGNVIAIVDDDKEVARYDYDAWGNCTIIKDIDGIGSLNPIRWKSHYYDNESGLYYIDGRYYSSIMKSYISACNIDEMLYNISIPGNFNPYIIGNPMHFPGNRFNIFTSMAMVPINIDYSGGKSDFWRFLDSVGRFVGGAMITAGGALFTYASASLFLIPGLSIVPQTGVSLTMYGAFMMASSWDSQIKADMDRIGWNPFNTNADMSGVNKVSFYKGQPVVLHSSDLSSFSFGIMFLKESHKNDINAVKHEWGHFAQLLIMGPIAYTVFAAIPSVLNYQFGDHNNYSGLKSQKLYYSKIWERTADWLGGVNRKNYDPFWSWSNFVPW